MAYSLTNLFDEFPHPNCFTLLGLLCIFMEMREAYTFHKNAN